MADYIKREDALNEAVSIYIEYFDTDTGYVEEDEDLCVRVSVLKQIPSADVVEVVRCKDCKHFEENHFDALNGIPIITAHNICTFWGKGCLTKVDGFCFAGEVDG